MILFGKKLGSRKDDLDEVADEVLLSLKVSEDEEDEIEEIAMAPHLFDGVRWRIRTARVYSAINRSADRHSLDAGLNFVSDFLVPNRSPRWVLTAVGVILFVATAMLMVLPKHPREEVQTIGSSIAIPAPVANTAESVSEALVTDKPPILVASSSEPKKQRVRRITLSQNTAPEIATDFFPLTFAAESISSEGGHLVRVTIPRSALVAMGLPVNVYRVAEHVSADVIVGDDGLARAIRFIQ